MAEQYRQADPIESSALPGSCELRLRGDLGKDLQTGDALALVLTLPNLPPTGPRVVVVDREGLEVADLPYGLAPSLVAEGDVLVRAWAQVLQPPDAKGKLRVMIHRDLPDEARKQHLRRSTELYLCRCVGDRRLAARMAQRLFKD